MVHSWVSLSSHNTYTRGWWREQMLWVNFLLTYLLTHTHTHTHTYLWPGTPKCRQFVASVGYEKVWLSDINCETPVSLFVCMSVCVCLCVCVCVCVCVYVCVYVFVYGCVGVSLGWDLSFSLPHLSPFSVLYLSSLPWLSTRSQLVS